MKTQLLLPYVYNFLENSFFEGYDPFYDYAAKRDVPVVAKSVGILLRFFSSLLKPSNILELGCGIGTAAKYMLDGHLTNYTGVDNNKERLEVAQRFLMNYSGVRFVHTRVEEFLKSDSGKYDFVFVDSIKKDYEKVWYLLKPLLTRGSVVIFDDLFLYGYVFQEESETPYKYREGVRLLRRFINNIKYEKGISSMFVPIENGLVVLHYEG
ncbi:MAG: methyltransferase domain-containing protein [Calditerrivibrio sp.]|nr:methyltransferase domain-containing protein [Calditerrivibrio sp.]